jgi:hypothetical protein
MQTLKLSDAITRILASSPAEWQGLDSEDPSATLALLINRLQELSGQLGVPGIETIPAGPGALSVDLHPAILEFAETYLEARGIDYSSWVVVPLALWQDQGAKHYHKGLPETLLFSRSGLERAMHHPQEYAAAVRKILSQWPHELFESYVLAWTKLPKNPSYLNGDVLG